MIRTRSASLKLLYIVYYVYMVICQLSSDTCAVRLIDSLARKLMLTCQDTRDGRKGGGRGASIESLDEAREIKMKLPKR